MAERIYVPKVGETVRDRLKKANGVVMEVGANGAWLRPPGGGVEWIGYLSEIEPVEALEPVRQPTGAKAMLRAGHDQ